MKDHVWNLVHSTMNNTEYRLRWQRHAPNPQHRATMEEQGCLDRVHMKDQESASLHRDQNPAWSVKCCEAVCLAMCCQNNAQLNMTPGLIFYNRSSHHIQIFLVVM